VLWRRRPRRSVESRFFSGSLNDDGAFEFFRGGLRDLGWVEGQNLVLDIRRTNGDDQLAWPAAELVQLQPEVILAASAGVAKVLQDLSASIAIVISGLGDPVTLGLAASLARPGAMSPG
jgi:ABC-type uncharacterized transport system substrate-binding protein